MAGKKFKCWNCGTIVTAEERDSAGGECPNCDTELCPHCDTEFFLFEYCEQYQKQITQLEQEVKELKAAINLSIGFVESTGGCEETIRSLRDVLNKESK